MVEREIGKAPDVLFTRRAVTAFNALNAVPKDCRIALPAEAAMAWKQSRPFRQKLPRLPLGAWTGQVGLDSSKSHIITDTGGFTEVTEEDGWAVGACDRSWHVPGDRRVRLKYLNRTLDPAHAWLMVSADSEREIGAPVAYVKLEERADPGSEAARLGPLSRREDRIDSLTENAIAIGLPERHAAVLARIAVRKRLDTRVNDLMSFERGYEESARRYKEMWDDPVAFAESAKLFRTRSGKRFPRYGNLSVSYTNASPFQVVGRLIRDAAEARSVYSMLREMDGSCSEGREYDRDLYGMQRERELEAAFRQDMRGNGINQSMVDALFKELGYEHMEERSSSYIDAPTKKIVMDSFYVFFSSPEGDAFLMGWGSGEDRPKLVESFVKRFWNDPEVNPALIDAKPEEVGSPAFERRRLEFFDSLRYKDDGTSLRRGDIDLRGHF